MSLLFVRVKWEKRVRFKCLSSTLAIRKGTHTASCYFRYLIFLTTELQLAVFELPAAVPEKFNRYKAFMSPILTTCSSPVTVMQMVKVVRKKSLFTICAISSIDKCKIRLYDVKKRASLGERALQVIQGTTRTIGYKTRGKNHNHACLYSSFCKPTTQKTPPRCKKMFQLTGTFPCARCTSRRDSTQVFV